MKNHLQIGDPETLPEFSEALRCLSPGEEKEFDVTYPDDYYVQPELSGKTARFRLKLKLLRSKELPEVNDEFAKDLGDLRLWSSSREALRKSIFREKEFGAQQKAKEELIDKLIEMHDFPVPEAYVERQVEAGAEAQFRRATGKDVDINRVKQTIDWSGLKEKLHPKAVHDVKASLLIERVAEVEGVHATRDEVDREVQRIARQEREPVAAVRKKLKNSGAIGRIAHRIRAEKAVNLLFEHARKEA